jgi:hypothetical protein
MTSGTTGCVLTASQAGNANYLAAPDVAHTVAAALRAASVTPDSASKALGAADPTPLTTGTLSGFLAGDAVTATYSRTAGEALGTYTISATLSPAGVLGNYSITYNTATFTIDLGAAKTYGILAYSTVTCAGVSTIAGSVGVAPGTNVDAACHITSPGDLTPHLNDLAAEEAQTALTAALDSLGAMTCGSTIVADLGGDTLTAGVYCGGAVGVTGTVTLNGNGNANARFVIRATSTLITAGNVVLIGGAQAKNVYWWVGSSATLDNGSSGSQWQGDILAQTTITINGNVTLLGRALARDGAVNLGTGNTITLP